MLIFHRLTSSWGFPQVSCPLCCILHHRGRYSENKVFMNTKQFPHQGPKKDMGTRITPNVHHATKSSMLLIAWIGVAYNYSKCKICSLFDLGNCFFSRNDYYSGQWATFTFDSLLKWIELNQVIKRILKCIFLYAVCLIDLESV